MLRKVFHIIFSLVVLTATTGISISKHYCGGRLAAISLDMNAEPCCNMDGDCCHNELEFIQLNTEFLATNIADNLQVTFSIEPVIFESKHTYYTGSMTSISVTIEDPPPLDRSRSLALWQSYLC